MKHIYKCQTLKCGAAASGKLRIDGLAYCKFCFEKMRMENMKRKKEDK